MKTAALLIFIAVYALLLLLPNYRAISALAAAGIFLVLGIVPLGDIPGAVDWNVLLMLAGTMGTVDLFIRSNMPNRLSDRLVALLPSVKWLIIALALFAGLVSAFVDNVATVLMLAPVALPHPVRGEQQQVAALEAENENLKAENAALDDTAPESGDEEANPIDRFFDGVDIGSSTAEMDFVAGSWANAWEAECRNVAEWLKKQLPRHEDQAL